jgi:hypothetical protein
MYTAKPDQPWEECFIVRQVKLPKGYHFGLSAATGDLADNHDMISFKVSDPQPMDDEEREELAKRVQIDREAGVETEVHHDPQYENEEQTVGTPIPLHYSLLAIVGCAVIVGTLTTPIYPHPSTVVKQTAMFDPPAPCATDDCFIHRRRPARVP